MITRFAVVLTSVLALSACKGKAKGGADVLGSGARAMPFGTVATVIPGTSKRAALDAVKVLKDEAGAIEMLVGHDDNGRYTIALNPDLNVSEVQVEVPDLKPEDVVQTWGAGKPLLKPANTTVYENQSSDVRATVHPIPGDFVRFVFSRMVKQDVLLGTQPMLTIENQPLVGQDAAQVEQQLRAKGIYVDASKPLRQVTLPDTEWGHASAFYSVDASGKITDGAITISFDLAGAKDAMMAQVTKMFGPSTAHGTALEFASSPNISVVITDSSAMINQLK